MTKESLIQKLRDERVIPLKPSLGGVGCGGSAYAASQTTVLHMKRLSQTESSIFVILCVLCFQSQSFLTFIKIPTCYQRTSTLYRSRKTKSSLPKANSQGPDQTERSVHCPLTKSLGVVE